MATSLDLSAKSDLRWLAQLVGTFREVAPRTDFFIAGAIARDLLLLHAHGIDTGRRTADVDLAVAVESWRQYEDLRKALIDSGHFAPLPSAGVQALRFHGAIEVDFVPFGPLERADRTIAWPPYGDFVMSAFGFREVHAATLAVALPDEIDVHVASLPALALLKLVAWEERRLRQPGKDAQDLRVILTKYMDAGNQDRLHTDAADLLELDQFDYVLAGAWLLGKDIASLLGNRSRNRIATLLAEEADETGALRLAGDLRTQPPEQALKLLAALAQGFASAE